MKKNGISIIAAALVVAATSASPAHAATCDTNYTGPGGGAWTSAANWSAGVPTLTHTACIPAGKGTIQITGVASAKNLTAASGLHIATGSALALTDAVPSASDVNALSGGLDIDGMLESAGSWIYIDGDTALNGAITGTGLVRFQSGTLTGNGSDAISTSVDGGWISPGGPGVIGALHFGSQFTLGPAARLREEIASAGTYDQIVANGNAFIGGTVEVHPLNAYVPAPGTSWNIVTQSAGVSNMGYQASPARFQLATIPGNLRLTFGFPEADPTPTPTPEATPTPVPTATPAPEPLPAPVPVPDDTRRLLLGCTDGRVVLDDVLAQGSHVALDGSADPSLAGQTVSILLDGKLTAGTTVRADGAFAATARLPRDRDRARYTAVIGSERSPALKLTRRLILAPPRHVGANVVLTGTILGPLAKPVASATIVQQTRCGANVTVKTFKPARSGRFTVVLPAPAAAAAVYRISSAVRTGRRTSPTFSLPLPVRLGG